MIVSSMANHSDPLARSFLALADPTRRAVLARLALGPATVSDLARPHGMALPTFLQHLRVLEDDGLITSEKQGRTRTCRLRPERIAAAEGWLSAQRQLWETRTDQLAAFLETGGDLAAPRTGEPDERP